MCNNKSQIDIFSDDLNKKEKCPLSTSHFVCQFKNLATTIELRGISVFYYNLVAHPGYFRWGFAGPRGVVNQYFGQLLCHRNEQNLVWGVFVQLPIIRKTSILLLLVTV